jgi:hypothetical protein
MAAGRLNADALVADMALCAGSADLAEGLAAWQQGRAPQFGGH